MLTHEVLQPPVPGPYYGMTFPAMRHLVSLRPSPLYLGEPGQIQVQPFAVGATASGAPVGLALAALPLDSDDDPELISLFVSTEWRNQGIATSLLRRLEDELAGSEHTRLRAVYMTGRPNTAAIERVLKRCGWQPPESRMVSVRFTVADIDRVPWLNRYRLRSGSEIFPWSELSTRDREELQRSQAESGWIPADLQPWDFDEHGFEPVTSLGMRCAGEVVGWIINHAVSDTTLRITCSFIRPDLGRRGRIIPLWAESFKRMPQTRFNRCSFTTPLYHSNMASFVRRWCGPWVSYLGETRGSVKTLEARACRASSIANNVPDRQHTTTDPGDDQIVPSNSGEVPKWINDFGVSSVQ